MLEVISFENEENGYNIEISFGKRKLCFNYIGGEEMLGSRLRSLIIISISMMFYFLSIHITYNYTDINNIISIAIGIIIASLISVILKWHFRAKKLSEDRQEIIESTSYNQ